MVSSSRVQLSRLAGMLRSVLAGNPFWQERIGDLPIDPDRIETLDHPFDALDLIPLTGKKDLEADQAGTPPFGTNLTYPLDRYVRFHRTSGTTGGSVVFLDTAESWEWILGCWREIWAGVGLLPSDRVFFPFSFGPFIGFWGAFEGAVRAGSLVLPGGGMTTAARLRAVIDAGATFLAVTPTYALHLAEVAREEGIDIAGSAVRGILVAGEPGGSVPGTRERIEGAWNARCFDHCGMTEVGSYGFECVANRGGLHVLEDEFLIEVIDPESGRRLPDGARGELVITNLGRWGSPAIRYRTGDLVRSSRAPCPCGRSLVRLDGGILGRIDQMVFIRGNNVYPSAIEAIIRRFPEIVEYRIVVRRRGAMNELRVELEPRGDRAADAGLRGRVVAAIEAALLFRPDVDLLPPGALPRFELKAARFIREDDPAAGGTGSVSGGPDGAGD